MRVWCRRDDFYNVGSLLPCGEGAAFQACIRRTALEQAQGSVLVA